MEYVDGETIDLYCDRRRLTVPERLRVFLNVCAAVHYAHGRGVMHRDLKPTNILVKSDGTLKLLDFGIAKVVTSTDADDAALTRTDIRAMTIEYASPEQIKGEAIRAQSDIYSLGLVLYELLTGSRPYELHGKSLHEATCVICEQAPVWPSSIFDKAGRGSGSHKEIKFDIAKAAEMRRESPDTLHKLLKGDLDVILIKALRKDVAWRYTSADEFKSDIERHLQGLPVSAHENTLAYRLKKISQQILNPRPRELHHNFLVFMFSGMFGALAFIKKQQIALGWRQTDEMPYLLMAVIWGLIALREGRRLILAGKHSISDAQAWLMFVVAVSV